MDDYIGEVIQELRFYVSDKRRSKEYRMIIANALSALEAANMELREAKNRLREIDNAANLMYRELDNVRKYINYEEEQK